MSPQRGVNGRAISSAGEKYAMKSSETARNVDAPCKEVISDDAERRTAVFLRYVFDELLESGLEGPGCMEEGDDLVEGDGRGGLSFGGESVGGGGERNGAKSNRREGGRGRRTLNLLYVERGADQSDDESGTAAAEELGEGDEGSDVTLGHEGEENHMLALAILHCCKDQCSECAVGRAMVEVM